MASTIFAHCSSCLKRLREIGLALAAPDRSKTPRVRQDQVNDELDRLSLWVGNTGALHQPESSLSLETRLRDAGDVLTHIRGLLEDIIEVANQLLEIVSGGREGMVASVEHEEGDFDDKEDSGVHDDEIHEESELLDEISAGITRLFRVSSLIRQAAPTDLFAKALTRSRYRFDDQLDITHVGEKYPKLASEEYAWLRRRLGRAITQRRHYLTYIRNHRENPENVLQIQEDSDSEDNIESYTTSSHSVDGDLDFSNIGRIPKLDGLRIANKEEVKCPFCFRTRKFKNERLWRRHVFSDLRSYVCTFPDCDAPYFTDINEWFNHETQNHRVAHICILCNDQSFTLKQEYLNHMEWHHPELMQAGDEEAVLDIGRRPLRQISATDCPCCSHEWIDRMKERTNFDITSDSTITVSSQKFKRHLASHLEQLALFAIPIGSGSHDEFNSNAAIKEKTGSRTDETNISTLTFHNLGSPSDTTDQANRSIVEGGIDRDGDWRDGTVTTSLGTAVPTTWMNTTIYYYLFCDLDVIMDIQERHKVRIKALGDSWQVHNQDSIGLLIEGEHEAVQAALSELFQQESLLEAVFMEAPEYETIALAGQGAFASAFLQWTHLCEFERRYGVRIQLWPQVDYIVSGRKERVHVVTEVMRPLQKDFLHRDTLAEAVHHLTLEDDPVAERSLTRKSTVESTKQTLSKTPLNASTESSQNQIVTLRFPREIFDAIRNTFLAKTQELVSDSGVEIYLLPPAGSAEANIVQEAYIASKRETSHGVIIPVRDELTILFERIQAGISGDALQDILYEHQRVIPLRASRYVKRGTSSLTYTVKTATPHGLLIIMLTAKPAELSPPIHPPHPTTFPFHPIPGLSNFRDIGGWPCTPPMHVRRGILYRGSDTTRITSEGIAKLQDLNIKTDYDLRSTQQIKRTGGFKKMQGIERRWEPVFKDEEYTEEAAARRYELYAGEGTEGIVKAFVEILISGAPMFRAVLRHLLATVPLVGDGCGPAPPAVFMHCTTGNNRTGVFISLLLLFLGVSPEVVVEEYTLSEQGLAPTRHINVERLLKKGAFKEYGEEEARRKCERMVGARSESMLALIEEVERRWGGAEGYFLQDVGLSRVEAERLREALTSTGP